MEVSVEKDVSGRFQTLTDRSLCLSNSQHQSGIVCIQITLSKLSICSPVLECMFKMLSLIQKPFEMKVTLWGLVV